eukprot:508176_1
MSAIKSSTKYIHLASCPSSINDITVPTTIDRNNYIVIDYGDQCDCVYKYNVENDKWNKIYVATSSCFSFLDTSSCFSAALDVKNQILFLFRDNCMTQIQLNNNINNTKYNEICSTYSSKCTIINNSLFIVGGYYNKSILKWNSEKQALTKFSYMYNKMKLGYFGMIHNHTNNCLYTFGGYVVDSDIDIHGC